MPRPSGMAITPDRASASGVSRDGPAPSMRTVPAVGRRRPPITFNSVLLPAPFGPKIANTPPGTDRSTPCSTSMRP